MADESQSPPQGVQRLVAMGPMRSGNVLLERLLTAQAEVSGAHPMDRFLHQANKLGFGWDTALSAKQIDYLAHVASQALKFMGVDVRRERLDGCTLDALHRSAVCAQAAQGARYAYVRMHEPARYLTAMCRTTDLRCLVVLRDPRDVMLSRAFRGEHEIDAYLVQWRRFARVAHAESQAGRAFAIRFEDLVADVRGTLTALSAWLPGARLEVPDELDVQWPNHSSFGALPRAIEPGASGRWRDRLDDALVRYAGMSCEPELELWGYSSPVRVSPGERARFAARLVAARSLDEVSTLRTAARRFIFPPLVGK